MVTLAITRSHKTDQKTYSGVELQCARDLGPRPKSKTPKMGETCRPNEVTGSMVLLFTRETPTGY